LTVLKWQRSTQGQFDCFLFQVVKLIHVHMENVSVQREPVHIPVPVTLVFLDKIVMYWVVSDDTLITYSIFMQDSDNISARLWSYQNQILTISLPDSDNINAWLWSYQNQILKISLPDSNNINAKFWQYQYQILPILMQDSDNINARFWQY
jgi:hypothetical protein